MPTNNFTKISVAELKDLALLNCTSIIDERFKDLYAMGNDENYNVKKNSLWFMLKIVKYNAHIEKKGSIDILFRVFLERYISKNYTDKREYYWYELKAILFFCLYFETSSNMKDFRKKILSDSFHKTLLKYSSGAIIRH